MPPIYATSTYVQTSPGVHQGYEYSRTQNPTRMAFERCIADLECGTHGFAFASGMAATATILELLDSGSHIVAMDDLYGGTCRLFECVRKRSAGLDFSFVDLSRPGGGRGGHSCRHPDGVDRDAHQSAAAHRRYRGCRRTRAEEGRARGCRQHVRDAVPAAPAGTRLRHRHAFGHQVHQRPFRHGRRCRRDRQYRHRRAARLFAELDRRLSRGRSTASSPCAA